MLAGHSAASPAHREGGTCLRVFVHELTVPQHAARAVKVVFHCTLGSGLRMLPPLT